MVAAVAAASEPYALAGCRCELPHHARRDGLLPGAFESRGRSLCLSLCLVADRFEAGDPVLERQVVQIGDAAFDGVVKPLESQVGLCGALMQLGDMPPATLRTFLAAVENGRQHFLKPFRLKQPVRDMIGNEVIELLHRDRAALAAGFALPRLDRAGVVAIASALPVLSVMAPPQAAQKQMPVRRVGPLTTRAGVTFGLRARRCACTASKVA